MDDTEVVAAVLTRLADRIGSERFELWFGANVRLVVGQSVVTVQVPNQFHQNWLRRNFRRDLEVACQEALARPMELEFRVVGGLARSAEPRTAGNDSQRLLFQDDAAVCHEPSSDAAMAVLERPAKRARVAAVRPTNAVGRKYASLQSFVVGSSNRLAFAAAELVSTNPGTVNPLFIYGGTGVGKSLLLEGILSESRRLHSQVNAVLVTAEQFTSGFLEALRSTGLPSFRSKYRNLDLLIVDDLQFLAGKRATAIEFVHTYEAFARQGHQLVVAADRAPTELRELGPELVTRLSGGMLVKMEAADHVTRVGIIQRRAAELGLQLPAEVEQLIATHLTTHARELIGALNQLLAASRIQREPVTRSLAEEALADLIQQQAKPIQFESIERAVCDVFGLQPSELQQQRRAKALNAPRMLAMWLARKHTRAALADIGQYFGRRSHSTVIAAQKTVSKWVADAAEIQLLDKRCQTEQLIRLVEARMRTG
jgi:chromosomal replication initiator protein